MNVNEDEVVNEPMNGLIMVDEVAPPPVVVVQAPHAPHPLLVDVAGKTEVVVQSTNNKNLQFFKIPVAKKPINTYKHFCRIFSLQRATQLVTLLGGNRESLCSQKHFTE